MIVSKEDRETGKHIHINMRTDWTQTIRHRERDAWRTGDTDKERIVETQRHSRKSNINIAD